ncbi:putative beta-glucosidase K [Fusarium oxysporum f. sp. albedinis]|nr:putative beta-glucosidase K [Fusarium oxysporum f. sp. albedinis]
MEALGIAANVVAVVDISVKVLQVCSQYAKEVKTAAADIQELQQEVAILHNTATKVQTLIQSPQGRKLKASQDFAQKIRASQDVLSEVNTRLQPSAKRGFRQRLGLRSWKWPFQSGEVYRIVERIRRCSNSLSLILQVDGIALLLEADAKLDNAGYGIDAAHSKLVMTHLKLDENNSKLNKAGSSLSHAVTKLDKVDHSLIMSALPIAVGAAYNSYPEQDNNICLKNTRTELLQDIDDWLSDTNALTIFWLQGMAGTGKSTIARTVATNWDKCNYLGASFFFKRGGGDRGNLSCFYTTIASQLAARNPSLASSIKAAIDQDPFITSKVAEEQFDKLILEPILKLQPTNRASIAIVIDALDECDGDENIKRLVKILTRAQLVSNVRMRVFITSRPELHVRLGFRAVAGSYQDFVLHEIPKDIIKRDIQIFFMENLNKIREEYNISVEDSRKLADTWPGPENTMSLVEKAVPLFIFAATVCRFISQRRSASPDDQLQKVLAFDAKSQESKLNATYLPALEQQLEDLSLREQDQAIENFHQVVGTIILLEASLAVPALAKLIDVSEESIYNRLDVLHSVLNYPMTSEFPVRLLHLSFRDFLLDPEKKGISRFWVDEKKRHEQIAAGCLRILNSSLKEDICNIVAPGTMRSVVPSDLIASCISIELQYACRYWVNHLGKAPKSAISSEEVLLFLERHLLHFLECLSLIGRLSELYDMIIGLQDIARANGCTNLYELLVDIHRFLQTNFTIVDQYPLQLYSSLRYTIPSTSLIHPIFANNKPCWIVKLPNPSSDWDQRQHVLEGHEVEVTAVSFSLDSTHMASLSEDGNLRVWRLDTGECIREIWIGEFTSNPFTHVAISTNPMWVLTCIDNQLRFWRGDTAELVGEYELSTEHLHKPQLSPCAQYCSFIDASNHVVVLLINSVSHLRQIYLKDSSIVCTDNEGTDTFLAFSPDSKHIATFSDISYGESLVWDIRSGHCIRKYQNKTIIEISSRKPWFRSFSFGLCAEGLMMVAFCPFESEKQIDIIGVPYGSLIQTLNGHNGKIESTSFLKEGTILGSSCSKGEIRTWDIEAGVCLTLFLPFGASTDISISPNYQMACSFYRKQTITIIWNSLNRLSIATRNSEDSIARLALSADTTLAASIFASGILKVWEVLTGECIFYFDDDSYNWGEADLPWLTPNFEYILFPTDSTAIVNISRRVRVWKIKTGQLLGNFTTTMGDRIFTCSHGFYSSLPNGRDITISPNGCLISSVRLGTLRISEVDTGVTTHTIDGPGNIGDVMFFPDSRLLILSSEPTYKAYEDFRDHTGLLSIYDMEKSETVRTIKSPRIVIQIVDISQNSDLLALQTRSNDGYYREQLEIIDIRTEETICELVLDQGASGVLLDCDFTMCAWRRGDDKWVISNISTRQLIARLSPVYSPTRISFNTGSTLLSTSMGGIQIDKLKANSELIHGLDQYDRVGYGISDDMAWILWNNTKLFWLPPALRPERRSFGSCVEVSGSTVMIGTHSGRVLFFIFDIGDFLRDAASFTL